MDGLRRYLAPEFVFGHGAMEMAGQSARNLGARKVLLVSDPGVATAGWTAAVQQNLEASELEVATFLDVTPNPRSEQVAAGAEAYRENRCDALVVVGGGSPIDCAKGIGIVASNQGRILDYAGVDQIRLPMPPVVCIPTTGGTSADVSQFAIITDWARKVKAAIIGKAVVPDVSLIDPRTLTTMDAHLTACTGVDALVHAIEAYVSLGASPITDVHALDAVRLVHGGLVDCMKDPDNLEKRARVMLGSLHAGLAFSNASLGGVHAMAHSLGGLLDLPHGECNAMLLDHVVAFNFPAADRRFRHVAEAMRLDLRGMNDGQVCDVVLRDIRRLRRSVGVQHALAAKGVHRTDVPSLAEAAMHDPCIVTNPRVPTQRDVEVIYEEAL